MINGKEYSVRQHPRTPKNIRGPALWKRAKQIIPGGNQLLSKRAEMFLPEFWPAYYQKSQGINVWDLNGNRYTDISIMASEVACWAMQIRKSMLLLKKRSTGEA